jgi:hypothetical protein
MTSNSFRIDVTFEMKTVLYGICLLIDAHKIVGQHFISNRNGGEEGKIAERERERERERVCVCVRQRFGGKGKIASVIK